MGVLNAAFLPLLTFFAPGFLFILTFFGFSRLTRTYSNSGILFDAACLVFLSFTINAVVLPIYIGISLLFVSPNFILSIIEAFSKPSTQIEIEDWPYFYTYIVLYFISSCIAAAILGAKLIVSIECASPNSWLDFIARRFTHHALYPIVQGAGSAFNFEEKSIDHSHDYVMAAVFTNIYHSNRFLLYYGAILDIVTTSRGSIECITLSVPEKFLLKIKDDTAETPNRNNYVKVFDGKNLNKDKFEDNFEISAQYISIYRDNIRNITFERYNYRIKVESERDKAAADFLKNRR